MFIDLQWNGGLEKHEEINFLLIFFLTGDSAISAILAPQDYPGHFLKTKKSHFRSLERFTFRAIWFSSVWVNWVWRFFEEYFYSTHASVTGNSFNTMCALFKPYFFAHDRCLLWCYSNLTFFMSRVQVPSFLVWIPWHQIFSFYCKFQLMNIFV